MCIYNHQSMKTGFTNMWTCKMYENMLGAFIDIRETLINLVRNREEKKVGIDYHRRKLRNNSRGFITGNVGRRGHHHICHNYVITILPAAEECTHNLYGTQVAIDAIQYTDVIVISIHGAQPRIYSLRSPQENDTNTSTSSSSSSSTSSYYTHKTQHLLFCLIGSGWLGSAW